EVITVRVIETVVSRTRRNHRAPSRFAGRHFQGRFMLVTTKNKVAMIRKPRPGASAGLEKTEPPERMMHEGNSQVGSRCSRRKVWAELGLSQDQIAVVVYFCSVGLVATHPCGIQSQDRNAASPNIDFFQVSVGRIH